jgi:ABC-type branched-subunit amino acid transport system substrate-binding protein
MSHLGNSSLVPTELVISPPERSGAGLSCAGGREEAVASDFVEPITRRAFLAGVGVILFTSGVSVGWAQEQKPLRVGMIMPDHGPLQSEAKSLLAGFDLFLKEKGSDVGNLEIFKRDSGPDDGKALEALTDLVMNKQVEIIVAPPLLETTEKIVQGLSGAKVVLFVTHPSVRLVGGELCLPGSFRLPGNTYLAVQPLAPWALKNAGKKVFLTGEDDPQSNEQADFFAYAFERAGGSFVDRMMLAGKTGKFKELFDAIAKSKADCVFAGFQKEQAVSFLKAYRAAAPSLRYPVVGPESLTAFPKTVGALGRACGGIRTLTSVKEPQELVQKIKRRLGREIVDVARAAEGYDLANIVWSAGKANVHMGANPDLIKFVSEFEIDGPRGHVRFDKNHEPVLEVMVQEWIPGEPGMKREIVQNLGPCFSPDFGCGRVGFPKKPETPAPEEIPVDSIDEEILGQ